MNQTIPIRSHTAAVWRQLKPVLAKNEPGRESDTGKIKYGNGFSAWADLPYSSEPDVKGVGRTMHPTPGTPVHAVAAALDVDLTGANNGIRFTAGTAGGAGNSISVQFVGGGITIDVSVSDEHIQVAYEPGTSTATAVIAAINASGPAAALVTASNIPGSDGSGTIPTGGTAITNLAGGSDATTAPAGKELYDEDFRYLAIAEVTPTSTTGWMKSAIAAL
jgi:hypothetical protein